MNQALQELQDIINNASQFFQVKQNDSALIDSIQNDYSVSKADIKAIKEILKGKQNITVNEEEAAKWEREVIAKAILAEVNPFEGRDAKTFAGLSKVRQRMYAKVNKLKNND